MQSEGGVSGNYSRTMCTTDNVVAELGSLVVAGWPSKQSDFTKKALVL